MTMSVDSLVLVVCVMLAVMLFLDATHCCEQQKTRWSPQPNGPWICQLWKDYHGDSRVLLLLVWLVSQVKYFWVGAIVSNLMCYKWVFNIHCKLSRKTKMLRASRLQAVICILKPHPSFPWPAPGHLNSWIFEHSNSLSRTRTGQ